MVKKFAIFMLLFLAAAVTLADEVSPKTYRVAIEVTLQDEELKERVTMYLRNELRRLGDVVVTDDEPEYKLYAMVTEMRTSSGGRIAYVLGVSVTRFFPKGYVATILNEYLRNLSEIVNNLESLAVYEHQFQSLAGPTEANLIETAVNVIAIFNRHVLEPKRQQAAKRIAAKNAAG